MTIQVYVISWDESPLPMIPARDFLPPERQARLNGAPVEKVMQVTAAYGLLRFGVRRLLGLREIPELSYAVHGKPSFAKIPSLQFNLSHTASLAVCAFASAPIGVDVERIRTVPLDRARRLHLPADSRAFFEGWVERESRIKCRGAQALEARDDIPARAGEVYHPLLLGEGYAAGVCAACLDSVWIEWLTAEEIF